MSRSPIVALFTILGISAAGAASVALDGAVALYRSGNYARAAEALRGARQAAPGDFQAGLWLGKALLKVRNWDGAVAEFERVVALEPANSLGHLWLGRALGEKASRASKFSAFGLARRVRDQFEAAVRLDPRDLDARFDLLEYYLEAPGLVGGGKDKARAQAAEIAARDPVRGFSARARIHRAEKNWAAVRAEYERAIREHPGRPEPRQELGDFELELGNPGAALAHAEQACTLDPGAAAPRLLASAARIRLRRELEAAERTLSELARGPLDDRDPSFAEVHYWLAQLRLGQADAGAARRELEAALGYDPDFSKARQALAGLRP
jgi:tetratricopeptide (TPR) repeat protein